MKRILCYGDSNTWGERGDDWRIEDAKQWPNILQQLLGTGYCVIQEGLGGRLAGNFDRERPYANGQDSFEVIYRSASPVDLVVIALGTNDLNDSRSPQGRTAQQIADDLLWYGQAVERIEGVRQGKDTQILYVCPANFVFTEGYFEGNQTTRTELIGLMKQFDAPVIDLGELQMTPDGVHYSDAAHQQVATTLKDKVEEILA